MNSENTEILNKSEIQADIKIESKNLEYLHMETTTNPQSLVSKSINIINTTKSEILSNTNQENFYNTESFLDSTKSAEVFPFITKKDDKSFSFNKTKSLHLNLTAEIVTKSPILNDINLNAVSISNNFTTVLKKNKHSKNISMEHIRGNNPNNVSSSISLTTSGVTNYYNLISDQRTINKLQLINTTTRFAAIANSQINNSSALSMSPNYDINIDATPISITQNGVRQILISQSDKYNLIPPSINLNDVNSSTTFYPLIGDNDNALFTYLSIVDSITATDFTTPMTNSFVPEISIEEIASTLSNTANKINSNGYLPFMNTTTKNTSLKLKLKDLFTSEICITTQKLSKANLSNSNASGGVVSDIITTTTTTHTTTIGNIKSMKNLQTNSRYNFTNSSEKAQATNSDMYLTESIPLTLKPIHIGENKTIEEFKFGTEDALEIMNIQSSEFSSYIGLQPKENNSVTFNPIHLSEKTTKKFSNILTRQNFNQTSGFLKWIFSFF